MQYQHHIHAIAPSVWPRGDKVTITDNTIYCELAVSRAYDLVAAYSKAPHIKFLNCQTKEDFQTFVQDWGPLLLSDKEWKDRKANVALDSYRAYKSFFRAIKSMIDACRGVGDQRESLVEYFTAEANMAGPARKEVKALTYLNLISPLTHRLDGDPVEWAQSADIAQLRRVLALCVEDHVRSPHGWGLRVNVRARDFEIMHSFELYSLWDALKWMLFYDEWYERRPILCPECPNIFAPRSGHNWKYCSPECAHRATNRKWRRQDLRQRKILKPKSDGGTYGPRKAR